MKITESSRSAIIFLFEDKTFAGFVEDIRKGNIDPYNPKDWQLPSSWNFEVFELNMDNDGAEKVMKIKSNRTDVVINITQKDDANFKILVIKREYKKILIWILKILGLGFESIKKFDAYKYDEFNMYIMGEI